MTLKAEVTGRKDGHTNHKDSPGMKIKTEIVMNGTTSMEHLKTVIDSASKAHGEKAVVRMSKTGRVVITSDNKRSPQSLDEMMERLRNRW